MEAAAVEQADKLAAAKKQGQALQIQIDNLKIAKEQQGLAAQQTAAAVKALEA